MPTLALPNASTQKLRIDGKMDRLTDGQTDRQTARRTDGRTHGPMWGLHLVGDGVRKRAAGIKYGAATNISNVLLQSIFLV